MFLSVSSSVIIRRVPKTYIIPVPNYGHQTILLPARQHLIDYNTNLCQTLVEYIRIFNYYLLIKKRF